MKNFFKFGFLSLFLSIAVIACDPPTKTTEGTKELVDSQKVDSIKADSLVKDSTKTAIDSTKIAH